MNDLKFSPDGTRVVIVNGNIQPKMVSRDGDDLGMFVKGDMYIRDMKHTA